MRYQRPKQKLFDRRGELARRLATKPIQKVASSPAHFLGRLGGEMAYRMVQAGLAYLTERAVAETKAAFRQEVLGSKTPASTEKGPKA
ncbi:MAG: hypothetical protein GX493_07975 [Firmicutes bacterium]|nr:hypothetical protein [Bacillota bacterium]